MYLWNSHKFVEICKFGLKDFDGFTCRADLSLCQFNYLNLYIDTVCKWKVLLISFIHLHQRGL